MKPSICVCCGETIPPAKSGNCKNPNVCHPCDYLVETGTIPALQELIRVLTNLLMRHGETNGSGLSSNQPKVCQAGKASQASSASHEQPMIHPDFLEIASNGHQGASACQIWRN